MVELTANCTNCSCMHWLIVKRIVYVSIGSSFSIFQQQMPISVLHFAITDKRQLENKLLALFIFMDNWTVNTFLYDGCAWNWIDRLIMVRINSMSEENNFIFNDSTPDALCHIINNTANGWTHVFWFVHSSLIVRSCILITMFVILSILSTITTSRTAYVDWHSCKIIGRQSLSDPKIIAITILIYVGNVRKYVFKH